MTHSSVREEGGALAKKTQARNSEAKFAFPKHDDAGIGYYVDGERVSPEKFSRRVAEKADRIRAEEEAAAKGAEEAEKGKG